jgi:hypothetical protein
VVVAATSLLLTLSYSGFCFAQKRFLSDEEFFDIAIAQAIRWSTHTLQVPASRGTLFRSVKVVRYQNVAAFRGENPDCCKFVPHNSDMPELVTLRHQIFGQAARSVRLTYALKYLDDDGSTQTLTSSAQVVIGSCGRVLNLGR